MRWGPVLLCDTAGRGTAPARSVAGPRPAAASRRPVAAAILTCGAAAARPSWVSMPPLAHPTPEELRRDPLPLRGRTALVTGASRRGGIGHAVARRLAAHGASVYLHHHVPHDAAMPWGADRVEDVTASVRAALGDPDAAVHEGPADLSARTRPPASSPPPPRRSAGAWTSWSPTTPSAAPTAPWTRSTPRCSTRTGRSTPARYCCWSRRTPGTAPHCRPRPPADAW